MHACGHDGHTVMLVSEDVRSGLEEGLRRMANAIAAAHGVTADLSYGRRYRATVNSEPQVQQALAAMEQTVVTRRVCRDLDSSIGAEDLGWVLERCSGAYGVIGNGAEGAHGRPLHSPEYDFNDAIIPIGVRYWVNLVRQLLPQR